MITINLNGADVQVEEGKKVVSRQYLVVRERR